MTEVRLVIIRPKERIITICIFLCKKKVSEQIIEYEGEKQYKHELSVQGKHCSQINLRVV